jgi:hypothetical protein
MPRPELAVGVGEPVGPRVLAEVRERTRVRVAAAALRECRRNSEDDEKRKYRKNSLHSDVLPPVPQGTPQTMHRPTCFQ